MINGFINGQDLRLSQPKIVADTIDYLEAVFKFQTADWNGLEKWAHFQKGDVVYDVMLEDDKISKKKNLNLSAGYWSVYLHGNAFENGQMVQRITTDKARLSVEESGVLDGEPLPLVPPSVGEQLDARITALEKGGGGGTGGGTPGEDGEDGGYYTPSVSDEGVLTWSASKEDMPPIPSSVVKGDKGDKGDTGADGVSPTVAVSKSGKVTTITITDANGKKTVTINDGADGASGSDGNDGVGIKSVVQTTTSSADGGSNVVTVTKTDGTTSTFTFKNGGKGSKGDTGNDGADGYGVFPCGTNAPTSTGETATVLINFFHLPDGYTLRVGDTAVGSNGYLAKVTAISGSNVTLAGTGINIKGAQGEQGIQGETGPEGPQGETGPAYTLTDTDKAELVQMVIESLGGHPVFGYVDADNNIIVQGNLADGTYIVKYEMEDGSTVDIGSLVLDNNVYYSVTNTLTNCTNSNSATQAVQGESYSATISANSGYELKSVTVTMGGSSISVTNGVINITSVTGNIVITAIAEEAAVTPTYTNQIPISEDESGNPFVGTNGEKGYKTNTRLSLSAGGETAEEGCEVTGYIPVKKGDILRIKNITTGSDKYNVLLYFDSSKTKIDSNYTVDLFVTDEGDGVVSGKLRPVTGMAYIRLGSENIDDTSIVTINEEIV